MPLFIIYLFAVFAMIYTAELDRDIENHEESKTTHFNKKIASLICFTISIINFCIFLLQSHNIGKNQLVRVWAWIDLFLFVLNLIIFLLSSEDENVIK